MGGRLKIAPIKNWSTSTVWLRTFYCFIISKAQLQHTSMTRKCDLQTRCTNYMMAWNLCCLERYTQCRGEIVKRSWIDSLHPQERFTSCSSWLKSKRMEFCSPVPTKKVVDENIFPAAIFWNSFLYLWYNGLTRLLQSWHLVGSLHKLKYKIRCK